MEALSLLRYWRSNAGGDATSNADVNVTTSTSTSTATAIVTAASSQTSETGDEEDDDNDHGPFFDLEFSLPAEGSEGREDDLVEIGEVENSIDDNSDGSDEVEGETELKLTLFSGSSGECTAYDDLFFNGGFVPVEQTEDVNLEPTLQSQSRVSLMKLKSATKFRVMMLRFKKLKSKDGEKKEEETEKSDRNGESEGSSNSGKSMAVVPIVSLFKRRNSSKATKNKQNENENENESVSAHLEEKKFTKEAVQKYLRKVKPLYVREKLKFTGNLNLNLSNLSLQRDTKPNSVPSPATEEQKQCPIPNPRREKQSIPEVSEPPLLPSNIKLLKQGNLPAGLRVVCKHLRKSRSAFTAVAAAPPGAISSNRRDDSLLQQQDGIQSAILHCKRSFKASRDSDCSSSSGSDPAPAEGKSEKSWSSDAADGEEEAEKMYGK